jgi:hypothetical protein
MNGVIGFSLTLENFAKPDAVGNAGSRSEPPSSQIPVDQQDRLTGERSGDGQARSDRGFAFIRLGAGYQDRPSGL